MIVIADRVLLEFLVLVRRRDSVLRLTVILHTINANCDCSVLTVTSQLDLV